MSIFVDAVGYYFLLNYPYNTNWIHGEEKGCIVARLERQSKQLKSQKYTWDTLQTFWLLPMLISWRWILFVLILVIKALLISPLS